MRSAQGAWPASVGAARGERGPPHGGAAAEKAPGGAGEISAVTERAGPGGGGAAETGDAADGKQHRAGGAEPAGRLQFHFQAAGAGAGAAAAAGGQGHRGEAAAVHPGRNETLRAADAGAGAALGAAAGAAGAAPAGAAGQALSTPKNLGDTPKKFWRPQTQKIQKIPKKFPLNSQKSPLNSPKIWDFFVSRGFGFS